MSELSALDAKRLKIQELDEIRDLLDAGMYDEAELMFLEIAKRLREDELYRAVGNLTRDLHQSLTSFVEDEHLQKITSVELPDASERLQSIITMTADAANKTLDAVDSSMPQVSHIQELVAQLGPLWNELMHGHIDRSSFVGLCHSVDEFIAKTKDISALLQQELGNIMMAQGYQDLTGQMLLKVISLVGEVEDKLVSFLVTFGDKSKAKTPSKSVAVDNLSPQGPSVTSKDLEAHVASSQDEVDDLLASLGF